MVPAEVRVNQTAVKRKLQAYLRGQGRDEVFIEQFNKGYCSGIASLWLYAKWLQTQPRRELINPKTHQPQLIPRDDYDWFKSTVESIVGWNGNVSLLTEIKRNEETGTTEQVPTALAQNFERFISQIQYFQHQHTSNILPVQQGELNRNLRDTRDRTPTKEYSIAALFTLDQLKDLLRTENLIQDGKLILISSHGHDTALFKKAGICYYYDSNSPTGEVLVASVNKVADLIFRAHFFDATKPSPLGFRMFSFDVTPAAPYPTQEEVLDRIQPPLVLEPIAGYIGGYSGLDMANCIASSESVKYFLAKGVAIGDAFNMAAVHGTPEVVREFLNSPKVDAAAIRYEFNMAAVYGTPEVVREFLNSPKVDAAAIRVAFNVAAAHGTPEVVREFLNSPKVDAAAIRVAFKAAAHGTPEVVREFLNSPKVDAAAIRVAFNVAAAHGTPEVVREFLNSPKVDAAAIRVAFNVAAAHGTPEVVREFLNSPKVDAAAIRDEFNGAAAHGTPEVVREFLNSPKVDAAAIRDEFNGAAAHGTPEVVREFLNSPKVDAAAIRDAFNGAAAQGTPEVVREFLNSPKVDAAAIRVAFNVAAQYGKPGVVRVFLSSPNVGAAAIKDAFDIAAHGTPEVVRGAVAFRI